MPYRLSLCSDSAEQPSATLPLPSRPLPHVLQTKAPSKEQLVVNRDQEFQMQSRIHNQFRWFPPSCQTPNDRIRVCATQPPKVGDNRAFDALLPHRPGARRPYRFRLSSFAAPGETTIIAVVLERGSYGKKKEKKRFLSNTPHDCFLPVKAGEM